MSLVRRMQALGSHGRALRFSRLLFIGILLVGFAVSRPAVPCTTFLAQHAGQPVFGRNYDWNVGAAIVVMNPRGLQKTSIVLDPRNSAATWTSKYASVTFNQYGVEQPTGGMNEKGLVVELMALTATEYPPIDGTPVVDELQWVQYALDTSATVAELITEASRIRVAMAFIPVHYLACDKAGVCAAFEYLSGQLVVTTGAAMPAKTLSNDTYAASEAYLAGFSGFGGAAPAPSTSSSLDRFARASITALTTVGTTIPDSAYQILDSVAQGPATQWSIVYVPGESTVYYRTQTTPKVKSVKLAGSDCPASRKAIDIDADLQGDVTAAMTEYTDQMGASVLDRSFAPIASALPAGVEGLVLGYAHSPACMAYAVDAGVDGGGLASPGFDAEAAGGAGGASTSVTPGTGGAGAAETSSSGGCSCTTGASLPGDLLGWILAGVALLARRRRASR